MVIKLIHIVSALVLAAAAYIAIQNRSEFKEARLEKNRLNSEVIEPNVKRYNDLLDNISKEISDRRTAQATSEQRQIALNAANANVQAKQADLTRISQDIEQKTAELTRLELELREKLGDTSPDELAQTIERLTQEVAGLRTEAEQQAKELEVAQKRAEERQVAVAALRNSASQRNKGINLNSFQATVEAVNNDYGFVVIGAGARQGLTGDSKLIVRRGNQRIGILTPMEIEGNRTVADIVRDSVPAGVSIEPGDQVIIQKVQR